MDDLIDGMVKMMNSPDKFIGPVNLGNPNEFTMLDLAKKVIKLTNSNSKLIFKSLPEDDPKQRQPDIALAKEKLTWSANINLDKGLKETIEYVKGVI